MITQFRVQNYKALRDVTLNLTPIHLLIGPNDSGKTSLLEAMEILARSVDYPLSDVQIGQRRRSSPLYELQRSFRSTFEVQLQAETNEAYEYELGLLSSEITGKPHLAGESILGPGGVRLKLKLLSSDTESQVRRVKHEGDESFLDEIPENSRAYAEKAISQVWKMLHGVQFCRWSFDRLSLPAATDADDPFRIEPDGFGLASCLDALLGANRKCFEEVERTFCRFVPNVEAIALRPASAYQARKLADSVTTAMIPRDGKELFFQFQHHGEIRASAVSAGLLALLGFITTAKLPGQPRLLLIEEPENGIHPERLKEVISILRELVAEQKHTQVVLTSHSPYIVSLFAPEEVTLCHKNPAGDVEVMRLSDSSTVREQLNVFSLGEIWPAEEERIFAEKPVPTESVAEVTP